MIQQVKIDSQIALEIASHEAVIRQAYKDSKGVWTWSVGLTSMSGHEVERYIDKPQTIEHCLAVFVWALSGHYLREVLEAFEGYELKYNELAAALSFHWNTGAIKRATWVKNVKAGNRKAARINIMQYNKPAEIKSRREKERDLFFDGKWSNNGKMAEYTQLTAAHTPRWSSRVEIDVADVLERLLDTPGEVVVVVPDKEPTTITPTPTLTPPAIDTKGPPTYTMGVWEKIKNWFSSVFS